MLADPDFAEIAKAELDSLYGKINKLESELELLLIPKDEHDGKDIIMEIRGAAGGDEANILQVIYLECILDMLRVKSGKLM